MFYIAMEFIAGSTLAGLLQQRKTLLCEEAAESARRFAKASTTRTTRA